MILDAKEQWYTLENLEKVEHLQLLPIDADAIENGKRCLEIPEGVKSISEDAAAVYNIGSIGPSTRSAAAGIPLRNPFSILLSVILYDRRS